jgi:MFS superfamily sulfate permease-like transporter
MYSTRTDAAALRKNDMNIQEIMKKEQALHRGSETSESSDVFKSGNESPKHSQMSVLCVLNWYAYSLIALVFSGGFAVLPALSLGGIFARINAHQRLPQFTAMFILLAFYLSDFVLVSFVPKFTFVSTPILALLTSDMHYNPHTNLHILSKSSLLVMAAIDLVNTWFVKSYNKTTQIYEWLVIPFIVSASLLSGMLQALGMGVCISTFIFVAQFYRSK